MSFYTSQPSHDCNCTYIIIYQSNLKLPRCFASSSFSSFSCCVKSFGAMSSLVKQVYYYHQVDGEWWGWAGKKKKDIPWDHEGWFLVKVIWLYLWIRILHDWNISKCWGSFLPSERFTQWESFTVQGALQRFQFPQVWPLEIANKIITLVINYELSQSKRRREDNPINWRHNVILSLVIRDGIGTSKWASPFVWVMFELLAISNSKTILTPVQVPVLLSALLAISNSEAILT